MNNFLTLTAFEYKKIFKSKFNIIILSLIFVCNIILPIFSSYNEIYYNSLKNDIPQFKALNLDKKEINQNKGFVNEQMIKNTIALAQKGYSNKENYFFNERGKQVLNPDAQLKFVLPYNNIYSFINSLFENSFDLSNGSKPIEHINTDDINNFYTKYKQMLTENIQNNHNLSQNEKNKHIEMIKKIKTPFYNEYAGGWFSVKKFLPVVGILILISIAVATSDIFGKEYANKTDAVILSSKKGKSTLITAKIFTAITFAIISSFLFLLFHIGMYIIIHGTNGINVPLQFLKGFEYSTYPITIFEFIMACCVIFLITAIAFSLFCCMISAIFKNPLTSLTFLMLTILFPMFLPNGNNRLISQIIKTLFPKILNHNSIFSEYLYSFGNTSLTPFVFYLLLAFVQIIIFIPISYNSFKKHQIK